LQDHAQHNVTNFALAKQETVPRGPKVTSVSTSVDYHYLIVDNYVSTETHNTLQIAACYSRWRPQVSLNMQLQVALARNAMSDHTRVL